MTAANMFFKCRILSGAAAVVMLGTISAVAAEPGAVSYPRSRALADIGAWIASDTPLSAAQIVDVGPSAVTAVTGSSPSGQTRGFMATIAAESLDPNIAKREHIVSWTIPVEVDCDKRQVRLGDMTGFSARDLKSTPHVVRPADTSWVTPSINAPLGAVMRSLCDRDFKRPFEMDQRNARAGEPGKASRSPQPGPPPVVVNERPATKPTPLMTAAAANAPTSSIGHGASAFRVQIGSAPTEVEARSMLARLEKKLPETVSGFKTEVQTAVVGGKTVYRAVISGLGGLPDANALCDQLKASGQACFVHR